MDSFAHDDDTAFPPGTIRLETKHNNEIVLSPQPTSDPNDPLNWSTTRKAVQMGLLGLYAILIFAMSVCDKIEDRTWRLSLTGSLSLYHFGHR